MQPLTHNPGAAGIGTQVVANGARGLAAGTAATAEVSALVPAGADEVSAQAAVAFATEGVEALGHEHVRAGRAGPRGCGVRRDRRHLRGCRRRQRAALLVTAAVDAYSGVTQVMPTTAAESGDVLGRDAARTQHRTADGRSRRRADASGRRGVGDVGDLAGNAGRRIGRESGRIAGAVERNRQANGPLPQPCRWSSGYGQRPLQAQKRAMQATAQATSYTTAMATTPPLPEIELNHITHAVLEATNFLGINTVPIGVNESDYFVRMWNQAAGGDGRLPGRDRSQHHVRADHAAEADRAARRRGRALSPVRMGQIAAQVPGAAFRNAAFAHVGAQATVESAALQAGRAAARPTWPRSVPKARCRRPEQAGQQGGQQDQDAAGHADGHADGQPDRIHGRPAPAAGHADGHPTDAAADPAAAAGDVDVQPDGWHGVGDKAAPRWG